MRTKNSPANNPYIEIPPKPISAFRQVLRVAYYTPVFHGYFTGLLVSAACGAVNPFINAFQYLGVPLFIRLAMSFVVGVGFGYLGAKHLIKRFYSTGDSKPSWLFPPYKSKAEWGRDPVTYRHSHLCTKCFCKRQIKLNKRKEK